MIMWQNATKKMRQDTLSHDHNTGGTATCPVQRGLGQPKSIPCYQGCFGVATRSAPILRWSQFANTIPLEADEITSIVFLLLMQNTICQLQAKMISL